MHIKLVASTVIAALLMAGTAAAVSPASGQGAQLQPTIVAEATTLTEAEALAIALDHAKLTEAEITDLRTYADRDDGSIHWELHWRSGDWEYDYEVDRETGDIRDFDREYEPIRTAVTPTQPAPKPTEPAPKPTEPAPTEPPKPTEPAPKATEPAKKSGTAEAKADLLTEDEALSVALKHAGFSAGEISGLRIRLDADDRTPDYEIEFRQGRLEYEYEINAKTGAIEDFDREGWDD